jgi:hypothetical protein
MLIMPLGRQVYYQNNTISRFPNVPACNDKDFSEYVTAKTESSLYQHVQGWEREIPVHSNQVPATMLKGQTKKRW